LGISGLRDASLRHPVVFALLSTLALLLLYIVAGIVARVASTGAVSHQVTEASARLGAAALVVWVIHRLGRTRESGVATLGSAWVWLLAAVAAVYRVFAHSYAFFGDLGLTFQSVPLSGAVALNGSAAAVLEELAFRGAVLSVLLWCWAKLPGGVMRSVWLTAIVFGASHIVRLAMGQAALTVGLLMLDSTLAGVFYAALVLRGRSVWPAVAVHLALNAHIGARAVAVPGFEETVGAWVIILLSGLPLLALGLHMLKGRVRVAGA